MFRLALVFALVAACGGSASHGLGSASPALTAGSDHLSQLFAADAAHAADIARLGPIDGVVHAMRGNALYLTAGIPIVQGRHDIREAIAAATPDPEHTSLAYTLAGGDVSSDGNFGFTFGWLTRTTPAGTTYGTYMATWERDDGGEFRISTYYTRGGPFPHAPPRAGFPLFLGGAGAGGVPHPDGLEMQRRSVADADLAFAKLSVEQGFSIAFPTWSADFLMVFGARNFVGLDGKQEITNAYAGWTPAETLDWKPVYAGASESGDLGVTVGNATDTYTKPDGTVMVGYSKYLTLWARNADGSWRFIADGGAPSPAP